MARFLVGIAALLIGVWLFLTLIRAVSAIVHLAFVVAVVLVAISLISAVRHHAQER